MARRLFRAIPRLLATGAVAFAAALAIAAMGIAVGNGSAARAATGAAGAATAAGGAASSGPWTGTWAASPQHPEQAGFDDVSLRQIVHTTIGGDAARIRLTNIYGTTPLTIGHATVGVSAGGAAVQPGTIRELSFGGQQSVTIPPGGQVTSDGVPENVPALSNLDVNLYLPTETGQPTEHADFGAAHQVSYISGAGDHVSDTSGAQFTQTTTSWFFLDGVDVVDPGSSAVVALGDSITDGTDSTDNTNHRWPDWLADRLQLAGGQYAKLSVLNAGIGGNELLQTSACCGSSPSALDRLDDDVLSQPGVKDVVELLGTNDILGAHQATASQVIAGLQKLIDRVHAAGLRIFGATITPASNFTAAEDQTLASVNNWIKTSGAFDGVFDFSTAVANPNDPTELRPVYDAGGHLHPGDDGYHAMADAVDLSALLGSSTGGGAPGRACLVRPSFQLVLPGAGADVTCHPQSPDYTYDDTSSALTYVGSWTHANDSNANYTANDYDQTETFSAQAGAGMTVNFSGTGVELVGPLNSNAGIADVYLDGKLVSQVDTYNRWGKEVQQDLFSAQKLKPGQHELTVTVTGAKNPSSSGTGIVIDAVNLTS